jgi:hypothetical protein
MAIRTRRIISGSPRLENEKKIAENIAKRSEELRASLSTLGREHAAFRDKAGEEKRLILANIAKARAELITLQKQVADAKSTHNKLRGEYQLGKLANDNLKKKLEVELKLASAQTTLQEQKTVTLSKLESDLKTRIAAREADVAVREQCAMDRELRSDIGLRRQAVIERNQTAMAEKLGLQAADFALRNAELTLKERKAQNILAREAKLIAEESRLDVKGKLIQDTGKEQSQTRADLARKKALLGKIEHDLKNKGVKK